MEIKVYHTSTLDQVSLSALLFNNQ